MNTGIPDPTEIDRATIGLWGQWLARLKAAGRRLWNSTLARPEKLVAAARKVRNTGPSPAVLGLVRARSQGRCEMYACIRSSAQVHHRRPRRQGGSRAPHTNTAANLLDLCMWHHEWIERNRAEAYRRGLRLHAAEDPTAVPALLRYAGGRVLLRNDGTWTEKVDAPS